MKKKIYLAATSASAAILAFATPVLAQAGTIGTSNIQINPPSKGYFTDFTALFTGVLRLVLIVGALLVFAYLIMGGIAYITSGGEKGKTEAARNQITSAIIGLIILAASYAVLQLVLSFLGFANVNDVFKNQ